jgi:glycerol-3-phosphate O-acyltransferase / dihydroxyacetone phosphate acyltransferase
VIYRLAHFLVFYGLRVYFKIRFRNLKNLPENGPALLLPNHTNAFIDPILIASNIPQRMNFFARSDAFRSKFSNWILRKFEIRPISRIQEGYSALKNNQDETFLEAQKLLENDRNIFIAPEGICIMEKRIRPFKKGPARIAFRYAEKHTTGKPLVCIPMGLNYSSASRFGSSVFVNVGEPVHVNPFLDNYKKDPVRAINEFTKLLENKLKDLVVHLNDKRFDELYEGMVLLRRKDWMEEKGMDPDDLELEFKANKFFADALNKAAENDAGKLLGLDEKIRGYLNVVNYYGLRDHLLRPKNVSVMNVGGMSLDLLLLWIGLPVFILAAITCYVPYRLSYILAKEKKMAIEFFASVSFLLGLLMYLFQYILMISLIAVFTSNVWIVLASMVIIPLLGLYFLAYTKFFKKFRGKWRLLRLVNKDKSKIEELFTTRASIILDIDRIIS